MGLASAMIALVFLYYSAWIFVFGGELNAAIARLRENASRLQPASFGQAQSTAAEDDCHESAQVPL
jgi:uncharacterized BrkB/YihY/UPF0761 family membrane protein